MCCWVNDSGMSFLRGMVVMLLFCVFCFVSRVVMIFVFCCLSFLSMFVLMMFLGVL